MVLDASLSRASTRPEGAPPRTLRRSWLRLAVGSSLGLTALGLLLGRGTSSPLGARWWLQAGGAELAILFFSRRLLDRHRAETDGAYHPSLGPGMGLTLARGLLLAALAGWLGAPAPHSPAGSASWLPALLYLTAGALDFLDGRTARATGRTSAMGERLDIELDALGLAIAPTLAVLWGRLPTFYLLVSVAYYLFVGGIALRRRLGLAVVELRRRPGARVVAGLQMSWVGIALLPGLPSAVVGALSLLLMTPLLIGFVRDWRTICGNDLPDA